MQEFSDIPTRVSALIEPVVEGAGAELVDVQYVTEHGVRILRVLADTPEGIGVGMLTSLSREISTLLDVDELIKDRYSLEVSSPGLDRPLTKPVHFEKATGELVQIKTSEPVDGRRNFKAVIDGVDGEMLRITDIDGKSISIRLDNIDKARLEIIF